MDRQGVSFTLGQRLKNLREERGLSLDKLIKQLSEKYGISISRDSLMAYEISDKTRTKASKLPNLGMRVEYLYCLADFYGVSIDYLMGKTNVKNTDADLQSVCGYTGLSEWAIKGICIARNEECCITTPQKNVLFSSTFFMNKLLEGPDLYRAMLHLFSAVEAESLNYKIVPLLRGKAVRSKEEQELLDEYVGLEGRAIDIFGDSGKVLLEGSKAAEYFVFKAKEDLNQIVDDIFSMSVDEMKDVLSPHIPK